MAERKRSSITADELAAQMGKLSQADTAETDTLTCKEKPDEMDLAGAMKRLSATETVVRGRLPTCEDIDMERAGESTKVAETTLQAKRGSLKSSDTTLKQQLPSNDDINAEKSAETDAGETLLLAKRKLSRTATVEKSSLPTAEDIAGEKKDKNCAVISSADLAKSKAAAATYSADEVEKLIVKFEKAAAKQVEKAPEDIATAKKEDLKVSLISAENGLMAATEQVRDVCAKAVAGTTPADRDFLDEVFGRGCNCERFTRIREVLTKVVLSKTSAGDPRWKEVGDKMDTIEDILSQRGSFKAPVVKPPPVVVTVPKSFKYPQFEQSAGYPNPNDGSYVIGEDVMLEPELDGYAASFSVDRALPAGLVLDTTTGTISGSPTDATSKGPYVITATNEAGSLDTTISFGVTQPAPTAVKYDSLNEKYMVGSRIESAPVVEGGACSSFSVSPDLPNAIALNSITGELSGVASDPSPHTTYQITGQNDRGKAVFDFAFAVAEPAPTSLSYPDMKDQYLLDSPVECQAQVGGGQCTTFSVEPALPKGISLDARTGQISGTASEEAKTATYKVTAKNTAGQAVFELRLAIFKPREDVLKKICECTDVQELLAMDPGKEQLDSWMVWNVHRAHLNDPSLVELDFTGLEMPLPQQQEKIAPKLMKALELHNTNLVTLKLGSSNLQRDSGGDLAEALAVNKTLKTIIVDGNDLDYESIQKIAVKLTGNTESVVEQLIFGAQKSVGDFFGAATETALVQLMKDRHTIIKLGVLIKDAGNRNNIDRYTIQNVDRARRLAAGGGAEDLGPAEERPCSALMLRAPPDGKLVGEVFLDDAATVAIIIAFIAQNLMVPTKDQLMSFAKTQDKSVPFAKAAPAMKAFVKSLLDAVVGTQVVVTDAYGTDAAGHSLKAWSAPTENDWTFETIDTEGKLIANKVNKQPPIKIDQKLVSWLQA